MGVRDRRRGAVGSRRATGARGAVALTRRAGSMSRHPATLLGLGAGIGVHQLLALRWPELRHLDGNPLLVGRSWQVPARPAQRRRRAPSRPRSRSARARGAITPGATLAVLLSIDTLKTCLLVDATTRSRHDSDRELVGQGVGNAVSALFGGAPGAGSSRGAW